MNFKQIESQIVPFLTQGFDPNTQEEDLETKLRNLMMESQEPKQQDDQQIDSSTTPIQKIGNITFKDGITKYKGGLLDNKRHGFGCQEGPGIKYEGQWDDDQMGEGPGELVVKDVETGEVLCHYKGNFKNNDFHSYGTLVTPTYLYEGNFQKSMRHGSGKVQQKEDGMLVYNYEGMWENDKIDGPGTLIDHVQNTIFTGQLSNGKKQSGIMKMMNNDEFHGKFDENELFTGYSMMKFKNGNKYHGDFIAGKMEGQGVMRYRCGNKFTGIFKNGEIHQGEMIYEDDNESYVGTFVNGDHEGQGMYKYFNGEIYDGNWKDGLMHGTGLVSYPDGSEFFGKFEEGTKIDGKFVYTNGDVFIGSFKDGLKDNGVLKYSDGREFSGDFELGMKKMGTMRFPNGDLYNGEYDEDGLMSGTGKMRYINGDTYSGEFVSGLMHGAGKMIFANNAIYTGEYRYDLIHGNGEYIFPDDSKYSGEFREGLQHGLGLMSNANGETIKFGYWTDGEFTGQNKPQFNDGTELDLFAAEEQKLEQLIQQAEQNIPQQSSPGEQTNSSEENDNQNVQESTEQNNMLAPGL